jgi:hypothetical protein
MNPHKLVIKATAQRDFDNIDAKSKARIANAIENLKVVPFPPGPVVSKRGAGFFGYESAITASYILGKTLHEH